MDRVRGGGLSLALNLSVRTTGRRGSARRRRLGGRLGLVGRGDLVTVLDCVLHLPFWLAELALVHLTGEAQRAQGLEVRLVCGAEVNQLVVDCEGRSGLCEKTRRWRQEGKIMMRQVLTISVLPSPERAGCNKYVSLEFLKGM